jgi:hypothetical protein
MTSGKFDLLWGIAIGFKLGPTDTFPVEAVDLVKTSSIGGLGFVNERGL